MGLGSGIRKNPIANPGIKGSRIRIRSTDESVKCEMQCTANYYNLD
jgi:hypothetical protein